MSDLWNGGKRLEAQMTEICGNYAKYRMGLEFSNTFAIEEFIACCNEFAQLVNPLGIAQCQDPVFEGAQGLLLDQDNKEFFPHVTHSHTGMHNVRLLCAQAGIDETEIFYVSRTYLTRHGAGPLPGEDGSISFEDETNHPTQYQGHLRFAPLDDKLRDRCQKDADGIDYSLVLTHCDQSPPGALANLYACGTSRKEISKKEPSLAVV